MIKYLSLLLCTFVACCCVFSCGEDLFYESAKVIEQDQWAYQDTVNYSFDITDTSAVYNIYLDIKHSTEYTYQNIYLQVATTFPSGKRIKERLPINFADKTGKWYGQCNTEWCDLKINLQQGAYFNEAGTHTITLEQFMRVDPLPGIRELVIKIEDTGEKRK